MWGPSMHGKAEIEVWYYWCESVKEFKFYSVNKFRS